MAVGVETFKIKNVHFLVIFWGNLFSLSNDISFIGYVIFKPFIHIIWYQLFLSNTDNLDIIICFKVAVLIQ